MRDDLPRDTVQEILQEANTLFELSKRSIGHQKYSSVERKICTIDVEPR